MSGGIAMQMNTSRFEFEKLISLLRRSENDPEVRSFFGRYMSNIERNEYYGFLEFKPDGVAVVFNEAPWVISPKEITDPKELYLLAFHLYREGHEGYAGYSGRLPNGVVMGDPEAVVLRKMGQPSQRGGGNTMPVLNRPVPYWLSYPFGEATLRFQLDQNRRVEMATLSTPTTNPASGSGSQ
jgi:hypothetical protein